MKQFFEEYLSSYTVYENENDFVLCTPIMYKFADHHFSFHIKKEENGGYEITDGGQTLDYLSENVDNPIKEFGEEIATICKFFGITLKDDIFSAHVASIETNQMARTVDMFIGAMFMIANINITRDYKN